MAIAMTTGYSAQTEGALLCIEEALDWALQCAESLPAGGDQYPATTEQPMAARRWWSVGAGTCTGARLFWAQ